ncbi:MAG TPA: FAD-dependent oxidoreductase [Acidimicrobiia bacterium]|nr:FAD-dependent oxidoreductase [Acidimicrobiia bacterium]
MAPHRTIVVVGASLAGLRAAETLRREGYDGRLVLVGAESHLPYDRPPLSKELLAGELEPDQIALRKQPYDDLDLDLRLGRRATHLDVANGVIELDDGAESFGFDGLVVATGSRPRTLPGTPALDGIFVLRTVDDCLAIRARLDAHPRVVVIGAGFIGSEVAATCRGRGLDVTVLEMLATPLERAVGPVVGDACGRLHRDHGVDLRCSVKVAGFEGVDRVERVRLADGSTVNADLVVVGVGAVPETRWLNDSGLDLDDGVMCDETCLAAPGIVAAGDVARWPNPLFDGERMRVEHWTNATEQGVAAARRLLVEDAASAEPFAPVPFVWSDQYDVKIQVVGSIRGDDEVTVADGSLHEHRFVALFGRGGRLVGALGFSRPRLVMRYRKLIAERASWDDALAHAAAG